MPNKIAPSPENTWLKRIRIVLVGTSHPGNIGAAARAMKTMGLAQLAFVQPRCEPYTSEAVSRASGADGIIRQAKQCDSLKEALAGSTWVVGCSARNRTMPWPMVSPRRFSSLLAGEVSKAPEDASVAIVFGREDTGLTNEELAHCNAHVHIPTSADFGSLNLGAAVQVMAYECRQAWLVDVNDDEATPIAQSGSRDDIVKASMDNVEWDNPYADHAAVERLIEHMERTLTATGFHDPAQPRLLIPRLRRLFLRARLDTMETNILRGILSSVDRLTQNTSTSSSTPAHSPQSNRVHTSSSDKTSEGKGEGK